MYGSLFRNVSVDSFGRVNREQVLANLSEIETAHRKKFLQSACQEMLSFLLFIVGDNISRPEQESLKKNFAAALQSNERVRVERTPSRIRIRVGGVDREALLADEEGSGTSLEEILS